MMYDISGQNSNTLVLTLTNDWTYLTGTMGITNSASYLRHKGKPVVAIWGLGFTDRPGTAADAAQTIAWFKAAGCTVMGGVPTNWRTLTSDSKTDPAWAAVYRSFDEMDEGTAMLKMAPTAAQLPAQGTFVPLNIDGESLPSDWYLRLAGEGGKMLRREIPLSSTRPINP